MSIPNYRDINFTRKTVLFRHNTDVMELSQDYLEETLARLKAGPAFHEPLPPTLYHGDIVRFDHHVGGMVLGRDTFANELFDKRYPSYRTADRVRVLLFDGHTTYTRYPTELKVLSSPAYRKLLTVVA